MHKKYSVIVPGSGNSTRFKTDKLLVKINNIHLIKHTIDIFLNDDDCVQIVLLANNKNYDIFKNFFHLHSKILLIKGEATRFETVRKGFGYVKKDIDKILIHDAARPFLTSNLLENIKDEIFKNDLDAVIPAINIYDSVINTKNDHINYVNRDEYKIIQTPQAFKKSILNDAYNLNDPKIIFNDEFSLVMSHNNDYKYKIINGERQNIKVTIPEDLFFYKN